MRLVYLGTPRFAVPTLEAIVRAGHEVVTVVTQPDRPKGRGQTLAMPPVKECALALGLRVFQPERIRHPDAQGQLRELNPDIMVVVGYGQIIPRPVIDIAPRGIVNVHASLLPRLRGAAPVQWAIARGDTVTGVTTMQIDAGLDTGDMLLKAETAIGEDEDAAALAERLSHMGAGLLVETLERLRDGSLRPEKQDGAMSTYAPILKKEDGLIEWTASAQAIHNLVRGLQPWPGAHTAFRAQTMQIWLSKLAGRADGLRPGTMVFEAESLFAAGGDGQMLKLIEIQLPGRRRMGGAEFARGQRIETHEKLGE